MPSYSTFISCTLVALAGCSPSDHESTESRCLTIAREYQAALADARLCDPAAANACAAGRPLTISEMKSDGTVTLQGLCTCLGAVNPARTTTLDEILARFYAQGCTLGFCWCPRPESMPATCITDGTCWGLYPG
jgi:hypothetical protein